MNGHGAEFWRKKEEAIAALPTQRNVEDATQTFGIGTATLLRWMKDPGFDVSYRAANARQTRFHG